MKEKGRDWNKKMFCGLRSLKEVGKLFRVPSIVAINSRI